MKVKSLFICSLLAFSASAAETVVNPTTLQAAYTAAADGDVLLLESGSYGGQLTFPSGKTITLKAQEGSDVKFGCLFRGNDASLADGGIIIDGVTVNITDSYFINLDKYGHVTTVTMRNSDIGGIGRCFLRTNSEGSVIDEIVFDNCVIHDNGNGGWNFIYPKHAVKKVSTTNSTLYNYIKGESFFCQNTSVSDKAIEFVFTNNTVYRWGKSNDRALAKIEGKYSDSSVFTFKDNIVYKGGTDGVMPMMIDSKQGTLTAANNLIVDYNGYKMRGSFTTPETDLTFEGLGITSLQFPDPDNGDFSIVSTSPLATASSTGGVIGDPRWLKTIALPVHIESTVLPAGSGNATPASTIVAKGETVTFTATNNYGYRFKQWQDENGALLSTDNPFLYTAEADSRIVAVFSEIDTYVLSIDKIGDGARWGIVSLSPEPVNGVYETGTEVIVSIVPNSVTSFLGWENGLAQPQRSIIMDGNKTVTAEFDVIPFIVAWDFATSEPRGQRPADYAFSTDNTGMLNLYNGDGSSTNWGHSVRNFGGKEFGSARRYTDFAKMSNPRAFVANFKTDGYKNVRIHSLIAADNDCVHSKQLMQLSTDGTDYVTVQEVDLTGRKNEWIEMEAALPEFAGTVYIRWIGDTSSELLGNTGANETEGFYLADVVVYADNSDLDDTTPPQLVSTSPAHGTATASAAGNFVLKFNERVKAGDADVTLDGKILNGTFGSKTVTYPYSGLAYGTPYVLDIPEGAITDMAGNSLLATKIEFTTMNRPQPQPRLYDAVVATDGTGDYTTIQSAIDAAPQGRISPWLIFVKNGDYEELVKIPATKPYIHLIGQNRDKVVVKFWINNGGSNDLGWEYSTNNPASKAYGYQGVFQVDATDFYVENITFYNSYGVESKAGPMGLAMRSCNDRQSFHNCSFRSFQDTWFTTTTNVSDRHYVDNCLIEGAVDYFYGAGDIYVENSTFRAARASGSVTFAPCHNSGTKYGYVIDGCVFDGPGNNHKFGRAWQNEPIAVLLNCKLNTEFVPEGWSEWHIAPKLFAEYNTVDSEGNLVDLSNRRTTYRHETKGEDSSTVTTTVTRRAILTDDEAATYTYENVTSGNDGWNPRAYFEAVDAPAKITREGNTFSWEPSKYAICYVISDTEGKTAYITDKPVFIADPQKNYNICPVNEYGSLGKPVALVADSTTGVDCVETTAQPVSIEYFNAQGYQSATPFNGFNIVVTKYDDGTVSCSKIVL